MALTEEQVVMLMQFVKATCDDEISCEDCLIGMAEFAETELKDLDFAQAQLTVKDHLDICPECKEEYDALLIALRALEFQD